MTAALPPGPRVMREEIQVLHAGLPLRLSERDQQALSIWRFNAETRALAYFNEQGWIYEVDLDRCTTSAQVLDWIAQVSQKRWATDQVLAALSRALDAVLDLQSTLCGCGQERGPIDVPAVLSLNAERYQLEEKEAR